MEDHWKHFVVEMGVEEDAEVAVGNKMAEGLHIVVVLVGYVEDEDTVGLVEANCYHCNRDEWDISVDYIEPYYPFEEEEAADDVDDEEVDWVGNNCQVRCFVAAERC